jgi:hypothetical protein
LNARDREFTYVESTNTVCLLPRQGMAKTEPNLFVSRRKAALP